MDALATRYVPEDEEPFALDLDLEPDGPDPYTLACQKEPWRCPRKPKLADLLGEAERLKADHAYRVMVQTAMHLWLNGDMTGAFPRDRDLIKRGEITPATLDDLKNEHIDYCNFHSTMNVQFTLRGRQLVEDEDVEAVQDYCRLLWDAWRDEFADVDGNGELLYALADTMGRRGALAAYVAPDPSNETTGVCFHMLDPATLYPVWEGKRGLARVYVIYQATAEQVIGECADNAGRVERKVRKITRREDADAGEYDPLSENEFIICYDRRWTSYLWGGELLRQEEHRYGKPPVEWEGSSVGMQGFMHTPDTILGQAAALYNQPILGDEWTPSTRQRDMASKSQPLLWRRVSSHAEAEAVMSRIVSHFRRFSYKPPVVIAQTNQSAGEGEPERDANEDGSTFIRADDRLEPYPSTIDPQVLAGLQAMMTSNMATGMAPSVGSPNPAGAQASGNAIDILNQQGSQRWLPVTQGVKGFVQKCVRCALDIQRDHGDALIPEGEDGFPVPRSRPSRSLMGLTDPHLLTPDVLERVGTRVEVSLRKFNAAALAPLVQAVMMARQSNLMSQEVAIEMLGAAQDIEEEMRRIEQDQLDQTPEILSAKHLRFYRDAAMQALREGNVVKAQELMTTGQYLADQHTVAMMSRMSMVSQATMEAMSLGVQPGQTPGQPGAAPAMQPNLALPATTGPQPNAAPYLSPNQFGGATGQQSPGRPPVNAQQGPGY